MTCLVTGGTGFIGARIVRDLVAEGRRTVVYDAFPNLSALNAAVSAEGLSQVVILQGDILDFAALVRACREHGVDTIIHMAYFKILHSKANPLWATRVNCEGTGNVFEAARILGLKRVVWASSIAVFGGPERYPGGSIPNDAAHFPTTLYGACKSFNEHQALHYCESYGLDIIGLRYAVGYGPNKIGSTSYPIIRELMEKPAVGEAGKVPWGESVINWLHVDDEAASAVYATKAAPTKTKVFTVAGEAHSVQEVADVVRTLLPGADLALEKGRLEFSSSFDLSATRNELGFHNTLSFQGGIRETINTVRRQHGLAVV